MRDQQIEHHLNATLARGVGRANPFRLLKAAALAAGLWIGLLAGSSASAIELRAWLNGAQVPLAVGGTGVGSMSFNSVTKILSWSVTYSGLSGACTSAHFHGPAAAGASASPIVTMTCSASPLTGTSVALNATQEGQLLSGQWYINIHTTANPGGEIRGQVLPVRGDFDGDGNADIFWRNGTTGDTYTYLMNGLTIAGESYGRNVPSAWKVAGMGDFNGDGKADIFWRNSTTGDTYTYLMNGLTIVGEGYGRNVPAAWSVVGIGDFDGDGKSDILWRNGSTGDTYFYLMNGLAIVGEGYGRNVPLAWSVMGTGDFNGDGKADIMWRNNTTGDTYFYLMNGLTIASEGYGRNVPTNWGGGVGGDFNGDGKADVFWRNGTTGDTYFYLMDGLTIAGEGYGRNVPAAWDVVWMGDFNGDGKVDIFWRNNTTGDTYFYLMDGLAIVGEGYGRNVPLAWSVAGFSGSGGGGGGGSNPLQLGFHYSGNFFGGTVGQINIPASVYYIANYNTNDSNPPASVFFTGPAGSGLTNTESSARFLSTNSNNVGFASPQQTAVPAGGAWTISYNGQPVNFTLQNPDSANRGIVVVPTVTVNSGNVTAVNWVYKNSAGTTVSPPQSFVTSVDLSIDGLVNSQTVRLYDQNSMPFATTAHTLTSPVTWSAVTHLAMNVNDDLGNRYTSHWYATTPPPPTISNLNPAIGAVGNTVTITGTNFGCTGCAGGVNAVRFTGPGGSGANGVAAQFTINSTTQITATVPAGAQSGTIWMQALGATATSGQTFSVN